ncbi:hypothetical protein ZHAS_00003484 [Anopheles sinensis]|uniref:Uncharacterized protein n=1 Tax=Anopheles sinensis TaxID=74873 RepID=A0A084VEQ3_ANOSI|nr:hypothetical protein ZHAS_00003484 [Anopheles sinensis]
MYESDLRLTPHDGQFCRLCFSKSDDLCPLFASANNVPNKVLLHKIFDCTTITERKRLGSKRAENDGEKTQHNRDSAITKVLL